MEGMEEGEKDFDWEEEERKKAVLGEGIPAEFLDISFLKKRRNVASYNSRRFKNLSEKEKALWNCLNRLEKLQESKRKTQLGANLLEIAGYCQGNLGILYKNKETLRDIAKQILISLSDRDIDKYDLVKLLDYIIIVRLEKCFEIFHGGRYKIYKSKGSNYLKVPKQIIQKICYRKGKPINFRVMYIQGSGESIGIIHYLPLELYKLYFPWLFQDFDREEFLAQQKLKYPKAKGWDIPKPRNIHPTITISKTDYLSIPLKDTISFFRPDNKKLELKDALSQSSKANLIVWKGKDTAFHPTISYELIKKEKE